jgi:hypothetical protein
MNPPRRERWRELAPWTAGVVAVHLLALQTSWDRIVQPGAEGTAAFVTRSIVPRAPVLPAPAPAALAAAPAPATPPAEAPTPPAPPPPVAEAPQQAPPPAPAAPPPPDPLAGFGMRGRAAAPSPQAPAPPQLGAGTRPMTLAIPEPAKLRYEVVVEAKGLTLNGEALLQWRHDGTQYEAQLELTGTLLPKRVQRSTGRITDEGLSPRYFSDKSRGEQAVHFDPDQGRIVFSNNRPQAALVAGTQDRLSVVVQLSVLIGGEPARYPPGTQIAVPTASTREAETWVFHVEGEEDLALPGGKVRALKLQRQPRREYDQKVEVWFAPGMDYAPVRVRLTNPNGDTVDQRWSSTDRG